MTAEVNEKMRGKENVSLVKRSIILLVCKNKQFRLMIMEEEEEGDPIDNQQIVR